MNTFFHPFDKSLRVHRQGNLDGYCGFYSLVNLMQNFERKSDLADRFWSRIGKVKEMLQGRGFLGADGTTNGPTLAALEATLTRFRRAEVAKSARSIVLNDVGARRRFIGLAMVKQPNETSLHWVALVGREFLEPNVTRKLVKFDFDGIV